MQSNDIEIAYKLFSSQFSPSMDMIKTLKLAVGSGKASHQLYRESISSFTKWYNDKYDKDIDSSYVENKLRAQETKINSDDSVADSGIRNTDSKGHLELGELTRHEGT